MFVVVLDPLYISHLIFKNFLDVEVTWLAEVVVVASA